MNDREASSRKEPGLADVTVGVITALHEEYTAAWTVLGCDKEVLGSGKSRPTYRLGSLAYRCGGGQHVVALTCLPMPGNTPAGVRAAQLANDCPELNLLLMCGIALAMPDPSSAEDHVRLGDVVVCDESGVFNVHRGKVKHGGEFEGRSPPRPPSSDTLDAYSRLKASALKGDRPWEEYISTFSARLECEGQSWCYPGEHLDRLTTNGGRTLIVHPPDPERRLGQPRIFKGGIASGEVVVADEAMREGIRCRHPTVKALEMEGSGVAEAAKMYGLGHQIVRGACDYGDKLKNDDWHNYAALVAACYTRALLEALPPSARQRNTVPSNLPVSIQPPNSIATIADRLAQEIEEELSQLNGDRANDRAKELGDWLEENQDRLGAALTRRCYETLARAEAERARRETPPGETPELQKAWDYYQAARNAE